MTYLFDTSVWIALAFDSHPYHSIAKTEFMATNAQHPIAFCRATQQSFIRLITTPTIQKFYGSQFISNDNAWQQWELVMSMPQVIWLNEPPNLELLWQKYARLPSASPKLWMDSYLAAFAKGHGITIVTLDKDFKQFTDLSMKYLAN